MPKINNPQNFKGEDLITNESLGLEAGKALVESGKVKPDFMPSIALNQTEIGDMQQKIQFIGNCGVRFDEATGTIIIRVGDNLNSSTFNTEDGQTSGIAYYSDNSNTYPATRITSTNGTVNNVWLKGSADKITIKTAGKIHFDDAENTKFTLLVKTAAGDNTYVFGGITGAGYYTNGSAVLETVPTAPAYLQVTEWAQETKTEEGATGYEANVTFTFNLTELATENGSVQFRIETTGTAGAANYPAKSGEYHTVCFYLTDNSTQPSISNVSAVLTDETTQTWSGITSVRTGTVTYSASVENLNIPATDVAAGASIEIDNTGNYAADITKYAQTIYSGPIANKTGALISSSDGTTYGSSNFTDGVTFTAWNINGSDTAKASLLDTNGNAITTMDVYNGTPNASITTNRITATSTDDDIVAFDNEAAIGETDVMIYHGQAQWPVSTDFSTYYKNAGYKVPTGTKDRILLVKLAVAGTKAQPTLTLTGSDLTSIKGIYVSSSIATLDADNALMLSTAGGIKDGAAADNGSKTARTIKLTYLGVGKVSLTEASGAYIKIVLASGDTAKISSITIG